MYKNNVNLCKVTCTMYTNITKVFILLGRVREDMDEPTGKLMGAHGYCTQVMPLTIYLHND